jgi:pSer/pThr/pTyr-binding forkhead associated (FHA) protein
METTLLHVCANCGAKYSFFRLYCKHCGCVLPDALYDKSEVTKLLTGNQAQPVNLQWGTTYFHRNAQLFLRQDSTNDVLTVSLDFPPVLIGRKSANYIPSVAFSPAFAEEMGISRTHARIDRTGTTVLLTDLNSTNGTFVNGFKLTGQVPFALHNGAALQLGKLMLRVQFT